MGGDVGDGILGGTDGGSGVDGGDRGDGGRLGGCGAGAVVGIAGGWAAAVTAWMEKERARSKRCAGKRMLRSKASRRALGSAWSHAGELCRMKTRRGTKQAS